MADFMKDHFSILSKQKVIAYANLYLDEFNRMLPPPKFKVLEFSKFTSNNDARTIKHVGQYMAQLGLAALSKYMKIRLFSVSLSGLVFG